MMESIAE